VLAEDCGCEREDVVVLFFPTTGIYTCLDAGLLQKCLSVPLLFHRNLWEQEAFVIGVCHQQAVAADLNLVDVGNAAQRGDHGGHDGCAVATYMLIAIVKKELKLDASLYTCLLILSVSIFEKTEISCALQPYHHRTEQPASANQLNLFDI
jgi:hypothetical protein